ncbi:MAG TPA: dephospho-CoA kinase [Planctomycetaceae bacterium]|nr:dephospho-CoA kinase [Planctomycetaceae bacterium]
MRIFGITGNIGSGKSTVAGMFANLGAARLDADRAGHEALTRPLVIERLRERWGDSILDRDGAVLRKAVAGIVFAPTEQGSRELTFLQELTHPVIGGILEERLEREHAAGTRIALLDAPLLLEAGWDRLVEATVCVDCPEEIRLRRVLERGWAESDFRTRSLHQFTADEKRRRARWIVSTYPATLEETAFQVESIWHEWIFPAYSGNR